MSDTPRTDELRAAGCKADVCVWDCLLGAERELQATLAKYDTLLSTHKGLMQGVEKDLDEAQVMLTRYEQAAKEGPEEPFTGGMTDSYGWQTLIAYSEKLRDALAACRVENESLRAECGLRQIQGYNEGKAAEVEHHACTIDVLEQTRRELADARAHAQGLLISMKYIRMDAKDRPESFCQRVFSIADKALNEPQSIAAGQDALNKQGDVNTDPVLVPAASDRRQGQRRSGKMPVGGPYRRLDDEDRRKA